MKRQRLGQHYLVDPAVSHRIIQSATVKPSERVLEIGTGRGVLTKELVGAGALYTGYEIDPLNFEATKRAIRDSTARLHLADAFESEPEFDVLVASLPYSRSADFVEWLAPLTFSRAVVVLQEDFVSKLVAPPGSRWYRGVSALAQVAFEIEILERVPRRCFAPPPKVSSAVILIRQRQRIPKDEASRILKLFSLRRRRVDSVLATLGGRRKGFGERRVYTLTPDEVHELCKSPSAVRDLLSRQ